MVTYDKSAVARRIRELAGLRGAIVLLDNFVTEFEGVLRCNQISVEHPNCSSREEAPDLTVYFEPGGGILVSCFGFEFVSDIVEDQLVLYEAMLDSTTEYRRYSKWRANPFSSNLRFVLTFRTGQKQFECERWDWDSNQRIPTKLVLDSLRG